MQTATSSTTSTLTPHARGVILMLISAGCFTANVLLTRVLTQVQAVDVYLLCCARFVTGLTMIYAFYPREFEPAHLFRRRKLAERGLIGALGTCGFYFTVAHLGAGRATFISTTYVVFGALLAVWMLGERFRLSTAAGGAIALIGLALLTNAFGAGSRTSTYDLLGLIVALSSAWIVVTIRQLHATEHTATIFGAQCVYGLLVCSIPAVLHWQTIPPLAWALIALASACAGAGQIMMTRGFLHLSVADGSLLQMLVPIGIGVGGAAFFQERFTVVEFVGAGLILASTAFTAVRR
jgi:drug/metabolite transporter (DMT)-like permease